MTSRQRVTGSQWSKLVEFLEINPAMAKGYTRTAQARQLFIQKWEELATLLNSDGTGVSKDAKSWAKVSIEEYNERLL